MTREQAIERWAEIIPSVWKAEHNIRTRWQGRLAEVKFMSEDDAQALYAVYVSAVAEEIVGRTSDEQLKNLEDKD